MTAPVLLVFGRGVTAANGRYDLTPAGLARVRAAVDYVTRHPGVAPRVVFSGGWAEASEGAVAPPDDCFEGDLMVRHARAAGLDRLAELRAETRSRSTLENLLHIVEEGLLAGYEFGAHQPLGLVSHAWHLPRVRYLAGKVLGLGGAALLDIPVAGDEPTGWKSERLLRLAARAGFLGVGSPAVLLRRERRLVAAARLAERVARVRTGRQVGKTPA
jgi:hypothetical protein